MVEGGQCPCDQGHGDSLALARLGGVSDGSCFRQQPAGMQLILQTDTSEYSVLLVMMEAEIESVRPLN